VQGCGDSQRHRNGEKGRSKSGERERKRRLDEVVGAADEAVCDINAERTNVAQSSLRPPSGPASEATQGSGGNRREVRAKTGVKAGKPALQSSRGKRKNGKANERDRCSARSRADPKLKQKTGKHLAGANQASAKQMRMHGCRTRLNACDLILQDGKPDGPCPMAALVQAKDAAHKGRGEGDGYAIIEPRLKFSRDKGKLADMLPLYGTDRLTAGIHPNNLCNDEAIDLYAIVKYGSEREQVKFWASMRADRAWEKMQFADLDANQATSVAQHLLFLLTAQGKMLKKEVAVELMRELGKLTGSAEKPSLSKDVLKSHISDVLVEEQEVHGGSSEQNYETVQGCLLEGRSGGERPRGSNVKKRSALQRPYGKMIHGSHLLPYRESNAPVAKTPGRDSEPSVAALHQQAPQGEHSARAGKKSKTSPQQSSGAPAAFDGAAMRQDQAHGVQSAWGMQLQPPGFPHHYLPMMNLFQAHIMQAMPIGYGQHHQQVCYPWPATAEAARADELPISHSSTAAYIAENPPPENPPAGGARDAGLETGEIVRAAGAGEQEAQGQGTCGNGASVACARADALATVLAETIGQGDEATITPEGASVGAAASTRDVQGADDSCDVQVACGSVSAIQRGQTAVDQEERDVGSGWRKEEQWQAAAVSRPAVCAASDLSALHEKGRDEEEDQGWGEGERVAAPVLCDEAPAAPARPEGGDLHVLCDEAPAGGAGGVHGEGDAGAKAASPTDSSLVARLPQTGAVAVGRKRARARPQMSSPVYGGAAVGEVGGGGAPGEGQEDLGAAAVARRQPALDAPPASTTCLTAATGADAMAAPRAVGGALSSASSAAALSCPRGLPSSPCRAASPVQVSASKRCPAPFPTTSHTTALHFPH